MINLINKKLNKKYSHMVMLLSLTTYGIDFATLNCHAREVVPPREMTPQEAAILETMIENNLSHDISEALDITKGMPIMQKLESFNFLYDMLSVIVPFDKKIPNKKQNNEVRAIENMFKEEQQQIIQADLRSSLAKELNKIRDLEDFNDLEETVSMFTSFEPKNSYREVKQEIKAIKKMVENKKKEFYSTRK